MLIAIHIARISYILKDMQRKVLKENFGVKDKTVDSVCNGKMVFPSKQELSFLKIQLGLFDKGAKDSHKPILMLEVKYMNFEMRD